MTDEMEHQEQPTGRRGEAKWKEDKERIADNNARAKKAGREQRQAHERGQAEARRRRELRQMADLRESPPSA